MLIDKEKIWKAKEKLGVEGADIIAATVGLRQYDSHNHKGLCCFHEEDTPSMIWNPKSNSFHCFGCNRNLDIIDAYMLMGDTYLGAVRKLFEKAGIQYSFGEIGVKTKQSYYYPKPEYADNCDQAYAYLNRRGISTEVCEYLNLKQDKHGNILIQYYDANDVLTMVKVRPSHKVEHGDTKIWCLKDKQGNPYGTAPLLYNMNKINVNSPLLICSGEFDCAAAIESGYTNAVSIPLGDGNTRWIDECFDWLEQFNEIIICPDNDESGMKFSKTIVPRLGSWRCKVAKVPDTFTTPSGKEVAVKDLNEVLIRWGKEKVLEVILNAQDSPIPSLIDFSDIEDIDLSDIDGIYTGIKGIDKEIMRLFFGTLTLISGTPGCVDCETEFFTGNKWKKISQYEQGDKVLQYNADGTASLVEPIQYHKYPETNFYHVKSYYGVDQMLSIEHNLVYFDEDGKLVKRPLSEVLDKHFWNYDIPSGFIYGGKGLDMTDEELRAEAIEVLSDYRNIWPTKWYDASAAQMQILADCLMEYAPEPIPPKYKGFIMGKLNADLAQFIMAATNHRANIFTTRAKGRRRVNIFDGKSNVFITPTQASDGYKYCFTVPSGMLVLRRNNRINITGNSGKTSFMYQIACSCLDQGYDPWIFSRELPAYMSRNWINYLFAGRRHICKYQGENDSVYYKVDGDAKKAIGDYYKGRMYFYRDDYDNNIQSLKDSMVDAARKYGSRLFILDNLTTINLGGDEESKYTKQTELVNWLIQFSLKYNVATVLICHPRKMQEYTENVGMYDIGGSSNLINLAHRALSLKRVTKKEREGIPTRNGKGWEKPPVKYDVIVSVIKDRMRGKSGFEWGLYYDIPSRRFYSSPEEFDRQYAWDKNHYTDQLEYPIVDETEEVLGKHLSGGGA